MKPLKSTYNARNNLILFSDFFLIEFIINFQKKIAGLSKVKYFNYEYVVIKIGLKFEISAYLDIWSKWIVFSF